MSALTLEEVTAVIWREIRESNPSELAELAADLAAMMDQPLTAAGDDATARTGLLKNILDALLPRSPQDLALVLGAVAALLTAVRPYVDEGKECPQTPPGVVIQIDDRSEPHVPTPGEPPGAD